MSVLLASFAISEEINQTERSGSTTTFTNQISTRGLKAHLILTPDGDAELEDLGFVHLHIEAEPKNLPDMTVHQTVIWLREALARMLKAPEPATAAKSVP